MKYRLQGSVTIPRKPTMVGGLLTWAKGVNRALAELRDRKIVGIEGQRNTNSQPPFWPTLSQIESGGSPVYKLTMKKGWVSSTHWKYGVQSVVTIEVTSIPGDPDPVANALTVISGTKVYATLTENAYGEITAAVISSGVSWPTSSAAKLIGGDDQTGAAGTRYVRLCEVVTVDGSVKVTPIHTGNIEHTAPPRVENSSNSLSSNEGRVLRQWEGTEGEWVLRYLKGVGGVEISEDDDKLEVGLNTNVSAFNHPWKATNLGTAFIAIAAGKILGIRDCGTPGASPWNFRYVSYAGGTVEVTSATGWIYAIVPVTSRSIFEDGAINTITLSQDPDSVSVVFDAADPDTVAVATTNEVCIPIVEVALAASIATVVDQVLTHNPTLTIENAISMP